MPREFKFPKDLLGLGFNMYNKGTVTFELGVTVLVGCNGCGKTTFMQYLHEELDHHKIPNIYFNNLFDGGENARANAGFREDFTFLATAAFSSEGENIIMNMNRTAAKIGRMVQLYADDQQQEMWILLDAIDSGLSIDNVLDMKKYLFDVVLNDARCANKEIYIIVSANEYEMVNGERCLDVQNMKYREFKTYASYRKYILQSKELKMLRDNPEKVRGNQND